MVAFIDDGTRVYNIGCLKDLIKLKVFTKGIKFEQQALIHDIPLAFCKVRNTDLGSSTCRDIPDIIV